MSVLIHLFLYQEDSRRGQEVQEGVWHRTQRPVVHRLPLEKGLPEIPWLNTSWETKEQNTNLKRWDFTWNYGWKKPKEHLCDFKFFLLLLQNFVFYNLC